MSEDRAMDLVEPYTRLPWVRGAYLVGSASRPFRDHVSDFDIEIAVDDAAHAGLSDEEKHVFAMDPDRPSRVDYEYLLRPWSELEGLAASTRDLDHHPFQHARVLYDPSGELGPLLARIAELPDEVRDARLRVHMLETVAAARRARKCLDRAGGELNLRLLAADAVASLAKLLFLLEGSWPAMRHWADDELRLLGVGDERLARMRSALAAPAPESLDALAAEARAALDAHGLEFHRDWLAFLAWCFLSEDGKRAFLTWGSR
jgi:hypothetical protein